jgi:hypothetical protein
MFPWIKKPRMTIIIAFCAWLTFCVIAGCDDRATPDRSAYSTASEQARVTSPNGQLDAVLVREPIGGAIGGGVNWNVYITNKGAPIQVRLAHEIFQADPMVGGQLTWEGSHLLEIRYDVAKINEFRNLWGLHEIEDVGSKGERDFNVEVRLVPSSSDFSLLNQDGSFKQQK